MYFKHRTKSIIDTVIAILNTNRKYKFVWAEMSFLSLWWDQATYQKRQLLKKLLDNKQLEIVTGGWVRERIKYYRCSSYTALI
jgi:alpha-mannosidase II